VPLNKEAERTLAFTPQCPVNSVTYYMSHTHYFRSQ